MASSLELNRYEIHIHRQMTGDTLPKYNGLSSELPACSFLPTSSPLPTSSSFDPLETSPSTGALQNNRMSELLASRFFGLFCVSMHL